MTGWQACGALRPLAHLLFPNAEGGVGEPGGPPALSKFASSMESSFMLSERSGVEESSTQSVSQIPSALQAAEPHKRKSLTKTGEGGMSGRLTD